MIKEIKKIEVYMYKNKEYTFDAKVWLIINYY